MGKSQREKVLAIAFAAVVVPLFCWKVVYPKWVEPMFNLDEQIASLRVDVEDGEFQISKMDHAREQYREYVDRTGGTNEKGVGDLFASTLNELLDQCRLNEVRVSPKGTGSPDRKTGLITLSYSIRAEGPLEKAVLFLKNFYELPYIARIKDFKLVPQRSRRQGKRSDTVSLSGSIDVLVPPEFFGGIPNPEQPPRLVKYRTAEYASIWGKDPFNQPPPKKVVKVERETKPEKEPIEKPDPSGWKGDPQRNQKVVRQPIVPMNQVMVVNTASRRREYVPVGGELDGADLIMVHPYGVLVRRTEGDGEREYVYPIGELLADAVPLDEASDEPQLCAAAYHFLAEEENRLKTAAPDPSAKVSDPPASPSDELAVRAVDGKRSPEPDVFVSGGDRRGPSTENATDLAGPPVELAGPIPKNEDSLPRQ